MIGKETRNFNQGMNQDVDVRFLQNGQYIDAQNIRVIETDNGRDGAIENVKSNTVKQTVSAGTTYTMPNGINRCIGSIEDEINARTFWFVWNSEGNHLILYYERTSNNIFELLKDNDYTADYTFSAGSGTAYTNGQIIESSASSGVFSMVRVATVTMGSFGGNKAFENSYLFEPIGDYLDFKENNLIQSRIIYKDGETLLFWTDDYNEEGNERIRYINVDKYINGDYPDVPKKSYFDVAQEAPMFRPRVSSSYDSAILGNYIKGKFYQFKSRYIGIDGQPSPWSPISEMPIYDYNSLRIGNSHNKINIIVDRPDGLTTTYVKKIEIAARDCGDGNSGDWFIIDTVDTSDSYTTISTASYGVGRGSDETPFIYSVDWYNNSEWQPLNLDEANYDYCFVPQAAKALEVLNNNRVSVANTTDGYDISVVTPDMAISADYSQTKSLSLTDAYSKTFKKGATYQIGVRYSDGKGRVSTVIIDEDDYLLNTDYTSGSATYDGLVLPIVEVDHQPPSWAKSWQVVVRPATNIAYNGSTPWFVQYAQAGTTIPITPANYQSIYGAGNYRLISLGDIQTWQFDQLNNKNVVYDYADADRARVYSIIPTQTDDTSYHDFQLSGAYTTSGENFVLGLTTLAVGADWVVENYKTTQTQSNIWYEMGQSKMCGYDVNGNWSHYGISNYDSAGVDQEYLVTPAVTKIEDADCYLGCFGFYESASYPPTATTVRTISGGNVFCETGWVDFAYSSRSNDRGRPNTVSSTYGRYKTEGRIHFSQPIVQETERADFSIMYDGDIVDNSTQFGEVNLIHQQSSNLYILQDNKISYRPVARTIIEDLESQQLVGISGEILGDANYLGYKYGCSNPESFAAYKGIMYFADINNQAVLAMSGTNVDDISKNGMKVYFDSAFNAAKYYNTAPYIYGGIDKEFSEYVLAFNYESIYTTLINQSYSSGIFSSDRTSNEMFELISLDQENAALPPSFSKRRAVRYIDSVSGVYAEAEGTVSAEVGSGSPSIEGLGNGLNITTGGDPTTNAMIVGSMDTISFNTNVGVWSTRYSFAPDGMCNSGVKLCSFKDGKFYLHNDSDEATFNTFYGTQYASKLKFAFNAINGQKKVYNTIGINADTVWTGVLTNYSGQQTSILSTDWESLDGIYWSPVYRDSNTPNVSNPETQGDLLVDDHLIVELSQTSSTLTNLYNSTGMFNISNTQVING